MTTAEVIKGMHKLTSHVGRIGVNVKHAETLLSASQADIAELPALYADFITEVKDQYSGEDPYQSDIEVEIDRLTAVYQDLKTGVDQVVALIETINTPPEPPQE
jgi:hypothetical protein